MPYVKPWLDLRRPATAIYLTINAAAVLRLAAPSAAAQQPALLTASAALWALAFGGFAAAYGRMLTGRRPVGA